LTARRAAWLSLGWLGIGLAVGLPLLGLADSDEAVSYWTVYVLERSLSLDNVFVFLLVLDYFAIPREHRLRLVRWGIVGALAVRAVTIAAGAALIDAVSVITYLLGAVLLVLALRMLRGHDEPIDPESGTLLRIVRRVLPVTGDASSGRFAVRSGGMWSISPLGLALFAFVVADLTFAVDSISAALGITTDFLAIWLANALALLGLVPLLVLVRALVRRFRYLSQTFAALLAFIGLRLLTEDVVAVGPLVSLGGVAAIVGLGLLLSLIGDRLAPPPSAVQAQRRPPRCPPGHVGAR
jgi:tellurite resistance protein TerC